MTGRPDGRARYRFVLYRPLQFLPVLFGISVITFVLVRLIPGDPARVLLGTRATPTAIANIRAQYGLDEPLWAQYFYFLKNLAHGEMGRSILYKIDVLKLIAHPHRADAGAGARQRRALDPDRGAAGRASPRATAAAPPTTRSASSRPLGIGFPPFWLALMLIILFSVRLGLFPVSGYGETLGEKARAPGRCRA